MICVLTHDPKFDVPVLEVALRTPAGYIGAMGSRRTHEDRLERLRAVGLTEAELARLRSPIGLDLGARTPEETAVSIAAELIQLRWGGTGHALTDTDGRIHHDGHAQRLHRLVAAVRAQSLPAGERQPGADADHGQAAGAADAAPAAAASRPATRGPSRPPAPSALSLSSAIAGEDRAEHDDLHGHVARPAGRRTAAASPAKKTITLGLVTPTVNPSITIRAVVLRSTAAPSASASELPVPDRLHAEEDQVRRAGQLEHGEQRDGPLDQRPDAERDRHHLRERADGVAGHGGHPGRRGRARSPG